MLLKFTFILSPHISSTYNTHLIVPSLTEDRLSVCSFSLVSFHPKHRTLVTCCLLLGNLSSWRQSPTSFISVVFLSFPWCWLRKEQQRLCVCYRSISNHKSLNSYHQAIWVWTGTLKNKSSNLCLTTRPFVNTCSLQLCFFSHPSYDASLSISSLCLYLFPQYKQATFRTCC